jgi:hypothetical protein
VKVDAAAVHATSTTGQVAMSLGSETVEVILNASSDDDPSPVWDGVKQDAVQAARNLDQAWRDIHKRIC